MHSALTENLTSAVRTVFSKMLQLEVWTTPSLSADHGSDDPTDVSAAIHFWGDVSGSIRLGLHIASAERIASLFAGKPIRAVGEEFEDALGELLNMIAGCVSTGFGARAIHAGFPMVEYGGREEPDACDAEGLHVVLPCRTDVGDFTLNMTLQAPDLSTLHASSRPTMFVDSTR